MSHVLEQPSKGAVQRALLLTELRVSPVSSIEARERLGILQPATRVFELRMQGHSIETHFQRALDAQGRPHRIALYCLVGVGS